MSFIEPEEDSKFTALMKLVKTVVVEEEKSELIH
jgi:hypothetical protein